MKKLRLNNIFHWLYAILMFLPFILLVLQVVVSFGQSPVNAETGFYSDFINQSLFTFIPVDWMQGSSFSFVEDSIHDVFGMFFGDISDNTLIGTSVFYLFCYWVEVSFLYLIFDVLMLPINIAHRWIDRGTEL